MMRTTTTTTTTTTTGTTEPGRTLPPRPPAPRPSRLAAGPAVTVACLVACLVAGLAGAARAATDDAEAPDAEPPSGPAIDVQLSPLVDGPAGHPMRWVLDLDLDRTDGVDRWVADRRLLSFELRPARGRRARCRHPDAPRRSRDAHVLPAAEDAPDELVDLRMYCTGRARRLLDDPPETGLEIQARYGFRRGGRLRWLVSGPGGPAPREGEVAGPRWTWGGARPEATEPPPANPPTGASTAPTGAGGSTGDPGLEVELSARDVRRPGGLVFRVTLRSEASRPVYLRDDMLSFEVSGPYGSVVCSQEARPISPIVDFFHPLGGRRAARTSVSASAYCALEEAFPLAGVYEVRPIVTLRFDGAE
ncbi:MAG TPA: hypothetical protein RMF84_07105, partial [Polyangiaceae bacterium LLY-WYZ-14_1]|nr:hypothetical protein [Polyangiaceae bacterium LLY-WYZ-14_1]